MTASTTWALDRTPVHVVDREADRGGKKQVEVPGEPLPLRLVVTGVVAEDGTVLAEWWLLSNLSFEEADAATIGRWYSWRRSIESYYKAAEVVRHECRGLAAGARCGVAASVVRGGHGLPDGVASATRPQPGGVAVPHGACASLGPGDETPRLRRCWPVWTDCWRPTT